MYDWESNINLDLRFLTKTLLWIRNQADFVFLVYQDHTLGFCHQLINVLV